MVEQMGHVAAPSGEEVVYTDDIAVSLEQRLAKMGAEKPCAARNQNPFIEVVILHALFILCLSKAE
jgi:hypothetical protein